MYTNTPQPVHLKDYLPPDYLIETIALHIDLFDDHALVSAHMQIHANQGNTTPLKPLVLNGHDMTLISVAVDDQALSEKDYQLENESLTISKVADKFSLNIRTRIRPQENTSLEGLYRSSGMFCTQCEAEGFRKITYYLDRPDVMAVFTTTIVADKKLYPVLLSNGNPVDTGETDDGRHWVTWHDPFKKPAYLFAMIAGDLLHIEDHFTTMTGRNITLRIYVESDNISRCDYAMQCLKRSMRWDEEVYGREYDLDIFMIVAVNDFNMGAMENKGLNVFNSSCVLASEDTATDTDYQRIEGIIGHEYFHNWSGNRVTCRDWFQLSLKEGFTVFRDQEFSADMTSRAVQRISDVSILRSSQFSEDAGPMAHPVRPASYIEISNFYTATVYNKGAEVVRMIHTLLGEEGFRKGTDLYFMRHDGQAVTTDDFVKAMEDANDIDLAQFRLWYSQAGTPQIELTTRYDEAGRRMTLHLTQQCRPTPGQAEKLPFHIPVKMAILDEHGNNIDLQSSYEKCNKTQECVLELTEAKQSFEFENVPTNAVPSLLRDFSAPVRLKTDLDARQLTFLLRHDTDAFNRWEAGQQLATQIALDLVQKYRNNETVEVNSHFLAALHNTLCDGELDKALIAQTLSLPSERYLADFMDIVDVDGLHVVREAMRTAFATTYRDDLLRIYHQNLSDAAYSPDAESVARRRLKNQCLGYLMQTADQDVVALCFKQFTTATNMTDSLASLASLANTDSPERHTALDMFYQRWHKDALVLDKWFSIQSGSKLPDTLSVVKNLINHPSFDIRNPNKVRAVIGSFCHANHVRFHDASGAGYEFLKDCVLTLDRLNPQIAARMVGAMNRWRRYDETRQALMKTSLEEIASMPDLSKDCYEIVSKALQ